MRSLLHVIVFTTIVSVSVWAKAEECPNYSGFYFGKYTLTSNGKMTPNPNITNIEIVQTSCSEISLKATGGLYNNGDLIGVDGGWPIGSSRTAGDMGHPTMGYAVYSASFSGKTLTLSSKGRNPDGESTGTNFQHLIVLNRTLEGKLILTHYLGENSYDVVILFLED